MFSEHKNIDKYFWRFLGRGAGGGGGEGSREKRKIDVSCGQNWYVNFPLHARHSRHLY